MKLVKFFQKLSLVVLASTVYITNANATSWTRHIYNNTNDTWHFATKSKTGNFYANCISNCIHGTDTYKNTDFNVAADEIWEIKMTTTNGHHATNVDINLGSSIWTNNPVASYCFLDDIYGISAHHNGSTGGLSLNSPASADVQLNDPNSPIGGSNPCN